MTEREEEGRPKRIGVFTKMEMAGGSEFRAVELVNSISRVSGYQGVLLVEKKIPEKLRILLAGEVEVHTGAVTTPDFEVFYTLDHLLIINTDSRRFTTKDYWHGKTPSHSNRFDLSRVKAMTFLFNFIVSPACQLPTLSESVRDLRIITANKKFFDEIGNQARYEAVRHYPRLRLESPINTRVAKPKSEASRLRFGMHSLPNGSKWNSQWPELIRRVNEEFGARIAWDFMGMPQALRGEIKGDNVIFRPEFLVPVDEYLRGVDVFVFFLEWKREEAWARSAGEALMSGCPIVTTARGGNRDQVVHGNTGFLCTTLDEFVESCRKLIQSPHLLHAMQRNARNSAREFSSENVTARLLTFLE